jgi:NTP pyrophosphatase (non-canonical NTP hydrolase)
MNREIIENIDKEELKKNIEELRDVLNEICLTAETSEELKERLSVSESLDKLIVKYMNEENER